MDIRALRPSDIPHVQLANITNLPENYFCKYYLYHAMSWPQLSYVAVDVSNRECGLSKLRFLEKTPRYFFARSRSIPIALSFHNSPYLSSISQRLFGFLKPIKSPLCATAPRSSLCESSQFHMLLLFQSHHSQPSSAPLRLAKCYADTTLPTGLPPEKDV